MMREFVSPAILISLFHYHFLHGFSISGGNAHKIDSSRERQFLEGGEVGLEGQGVEGLGEGVGDF